jgi:hypothetical protein
MCLAKLRIAAALLYCRYHLSEQHLATVRQGGCCSFCCAADRREKQRLLVAAQTPIPTSRRYLPAVAAATRGNLIQRKCAPVKLCALSLATFHLQGDPAPRTQGEQNRPRTLLLFAWLTIEGFRRGSGNSGFRGTPTVYCLCEEE